MVKYLKDYRPLPWRTDAVELEFDIRDDIVRVVNRMSLTLKDSKSPAPLELDAEDLTLVEVAVDGIVTTDYCFDGKRFVIENLPASCVLTIVTEIDPWHNLTLMGLYADGAMLVTQNEAEGFRRITCFADRPDNMSVYTTVITADKTRYPVLLSNGNLLSESDLGDGRHRAVWHDPFPKPSYLFALVAGDLRCRRDTFVTMHGRTIDLRIYVQPGRENRTAHAMTCLKKSMRWDEERFGLECDLDTYMIVATDSFNFGAMENKGLNIFNSSCVLADPATATDSDFEGVDRTIAHEYFHNYTGNRITCRDWFQLTLKEGLTVFRDSEYVFDTVAGAVSRIEDVRAFREFQFPEDAGPLAHPIRPEEYSEINNFYTATVYEKGAEVIRMIQTFVGRERFRKGFDTYFKMFDGQAVTTEDFLTAMRAGASDELAGFDAWYALAGTPQLSISDDFRDGVYTLTVTRDDDRLTPLGFALFDRQNGARIPLDSEVLRLTKTTETFTFDIGGSVKPVPSLLRDFSAPVKIAYPYDDESLAFLATHDDDPFSRYEAIQRLMYRAILDAYENDTAFPPQIFAACEGILTDGSDPRLTALMLVPPGLIPLCADLRDVDYPRMYRAREQFLNELAVHLRPKLQSLLTHLRIDESYAPIPEQVGKRALAVLVLDLLIRADEGGYALAYQRFTDADNMTDRMSALRCLSRCDNPYRHEALKQFREMWQDDSLVMDKWFAVQASAVLPEMSAQIRGLAEDPLFNVHSPNKVRALYGAFARNLAAYHAGAEGYAVIAEAVAHIDAFNPQAAARLAKTALEDYPRLSENGRAALEACYYPMMSLPELSGDLKEILNLVFKQVKHEK